MFFIGTLVGGSIGVTFMCLFQINSKYRSEDDKNSTERSWSDEKT
ncbi:DUF3789 domain-containing protein [Petroclostridium sp. X23]